MRGLVIGKKMKIILKCIPFLILLLTWESIAQWMDFKLTSGSFWLDHILKAMLPLSFIIYYVNYPTKCQNVPIIFRLLFILFIISVVYGVFMAEGYQDYQLMVTKLTAWSLCLGWFYFQNPDNISNVIRKWCKYAIPLFFFLVFFMQGEAVGRYFAPFAYLLIFFPYLEKKWKFTVLFIVVLILIFGSLGARSSILRFAVSIVLAIAIYYRKIIPNLLIKMAFFVFVIAPIILLYLGISGVFNVFRIQEELGWNEYTVRSSLDNSNQENLTADTRTFLYVEELQSAVNNNYVLFGRSIGRGYDSVVITGMDLKSGRNERWSCEVRMLNVFNYMGVVGVVIVGLVYIVGAYKAVFRSKSFTMQIIGIYVAFRWFYGWIEDFDRFDLINLYLWIPIIMCYSVRFLHMTDYDFHCWIRNFFKTQNRNRKCLIKY